MRITKPECTRVNQNLYGHPKPRWVYRKYDLLTFWLYDRQFDRSATNGMFRLWLLWVPIFESQRIRNMKSFLGWVRKSVAR